MAEPLDSAAIALSSGEIDTHAIRFSHRRIRADGLGDAVSGYRVGRIEYFAEISTNLIDWKSGPEHLAKVGDPIDNGDGSETVILKPVNPGDASLFFRVRVRSGSE